jgi:hypothetical protein
VDTRSTGRFCLAATLGEHVLFPIALETRVGFGHVCTCTGAFPTNNVAVLLQIAQACTQASIQRQSEVRSLRVPPRRSMLTIQYFLRWHFCVYEWIHRWIICTQANPIKEQE